MKSRLLIALAAALLHAGTAPAAPVFSNTAVVSTPTNVARFDTLTSDGINLINYIEDGLKVVVPDTSFQDFNAFNNGTTTGFHYGAGGNNLWVVIRRVADAPMYGLDFLLGDGARFGLTTHLIWQTHQVNTPTGSGSAFVDKGSTVGWTDPAGFTSIRIAASSSTFQFGDSQAIALDNVRVDARSAQVPVPATAPLAGTALLGLWLLRRRVA